MITKLFEVRDKATFIPVVAVKMSPGRTFPERYLLSRSGFGFDSPAVLVSRLNDGSGAFDPYDWTGSRTMTAAHIYIEETFDLLESGAVIDVEFLLGITAQPKISERLG